MYYSYIVIDKKKFNLFDVYIGRLFYQSSPSRDDKTHMSHCNIKTFVNEPR
jgi:hypothetical protein